MYISSLEELRKIEPIKNGKWKKKNLYEYLVWHCSETFQPYISGFFEKYRSDEKLLDLLFDFLLNEEYDGSDCQMAAAVLIGKMDKQLLKQRKELLLQAQKNDVLWKRPFPDENLDWLKETVL